MKRRSAILSWIVLLSIPFVLAPRASGQTPQGSGEGGGGAPGILEPKTFDRWPDPVVADCGIFTSLAGKKIAHLRLYAHSGGSFHPIPFQVDEEDGQGNRVYPAGEHANPGAANGILDLLIETVFEDPRRGHERAQGRV